MKTLVETYIIPRGDVGTQRTLNVMRRIVNESLIDPYVVESAKNIVTFCGGKDEFCLADTINRWIKDHSHFIRDPLGVELIHTPKYILKKIAQNFYFDFDCDDMAVLSASLGKAVGLPAKFVALGFLDKKQPLTHVYTILKVKEKWYPIDLKAQYPMLKHLIKRKEFYPV